jgi:hypothetical protein
MPDSIRIGIERVNVPGSRGCSVWFNVSNAVIASREVIVTKVVGVDMETCRVFLDPSCLH